MLASLTIRMPSILVMNAELSNGSLMPMLSLLQKDTGCILAIADHDHVRNNYK